MGIALADVECGCVTEFGLAVQGLVPSMLNRLTLGREDVESYKDFGVGAFADSYYEYLLKMWLAKHKQVCADSSFKFTHWVGTVLGVLPQGTR